MNSEKKKKRKKIESDVYGDEVEFEEEKGEQDKRFEDVDASELDEETNEEIYR